MRHKNVSVRRRKRLIARKAGKEPTFTEVLEDILFKRVHKLAFADKVTK